MRYAWRIDSNQTQVISALEAAGAQVDVIGKPVDLLIGTINKNGSKVLALFEIKDGEKYKSQQAKTPAQVKFFARWAGWPICLVDGPEAALRALKVLQQ
jgi:hypothetical protein